MVPGWAGALAGLVSGGVALGMAQLVAGVVGPETSPVVAVGDAAVDLTPAPLKEFAIRTFGESDKTVLVGGVLVVLAVIAAAIGVLARRARAYGFAGLSAFGVIGLLAVLTRPDAGALDVLPTLIGVVAAAWTLSWLLGRAEGGPVPGSATSGGVAGDGAGVKRSVAGADDGPPVAAGAAEDVGVERPAVMRAGAELRAFDRRRLLTGVAGGVVVAGAATVLGRQLGGRQTVDAARVGVALPRAANPAKPLPAGTDFHINGLSSFITKNKDFYRVDTALVVPQVEPADWTLRIHGLVDRPVELTYDDLLKMPLTEADVTLTCVSNEVGGPYVGNARWLGLRMSEVLRRAGLRSGADMLLSTSADGFTCGTPVDVVMDGREALFAVAMNGEALPVEHGFPVRQVVPGLYGYVSATKWVVDVKVTTFDADEAYWTPRGWSAKGPIKTQSRIDVPRPGDSLRAGRTKIAGVAWAQHTGVDAVEVRVDGGQWKQATLAQVPGPDTWRQWSIDWDLAAGDHTIQVRATDASGYTQTEQLAPPAPDGATGWHTVTVQAA
ncbi:DMSO/TMAO reductase YedYZ, molybdopterin-dependent catalytic subunit [Nonomuraea jiangxiensis]|uniref:DMSO/TMAO reductase YedYZ, molybdopterin-dependent catalytic subunit n=2 Tax=Nonomuraea jiangxiensis TaxID=633440 RepID=A0A1G8VA74_9ACTN|nr:molybdopterin-dependent oxidoreductase [Nonomuraea jiangxiensis]SDJ62968.1 DMSO/TMAO reductase YedYZ, molybdopterin-dependent catalytic subunit [Nonomuraea jiangxiensis]